jgi:diguanylate cyclase (GGDEF)-like protein
MLRPPAAVARRAAGATIALVPAITVCLLATGRATLAALIATVGITVLAMLLTRFHNAVLRAERRADRLQADLAVARLDPVTGLVVRTVAERHLTDAAGTDVTVALIDVDDMHGINTAHHHDGGDAYLAAVAQRLTHAAGRGDLVSRLGGDEFAIISRQDPHTLALALTAALTPPVVIDQTLVPMNVSVGICRVPGGDPHAALGRADRAMFTAKRRRSGIEHYDSARDGELPAPGVRPLVRRRDQRIVGRRCSDT